MLALLATLISSCAPVTAVGVKFLYRRADLPSAQVVRHICYASTGARASDAQTLDLYLPLGKGWPVILFVHGGNWDAGDKQLRVGGADVYANIGRFFASQGIGTAVINYRLQPTTDWRGQVDDVRQATLWVQNNLQARSGRPEELFLMGHSAGAHLSSFVALGAADSLHIRGVIAVSGAALDLTDQQTYDLGEAPDYYAKRFRANDLADQWKTVASPVHYVTPNAPPFLIVYAGGEKKALQRQARCLQKALDTAHVENQLVVVPGESHTRIVLTLSRPDKTSAPAILDFIHKHV